MERIAELPPRLKARIAGVFYLLTILTGLYAALFASGSPRLVANLIGTVFYVVVTLIFYDLFKPVNEGLSLLAAAFSLVGCAVTFLGLFHVRSPHLNSLVFFGFYCLLLGYLIFKSNFLPRTLGVLVAIAGLGWLTYLSPALAGRLSTYTIITGLIGEGSLTLWLLVFGVKPERRHS